MFFANLTYICYCTSISKTVNPLPYNNAIQFNHHKLNQTNSPLYAIGWPGGVGGRGERESRGKTAQGGEGGGLPSPASPERPLSPLGGCPFGRQLTFVCNVKHFTNKVTFHLTGKSHLSTNKRISTTHSQKHKSPSPSVVGEQSRFLGV